jgi:hypothetical protein
MAGQDPPGRKTALAKKDLKKELQALYFPSPKEVGVVKVPAMSFAMIDGRGNPNESEAFHESIETLYGISYTLKFMLKKTGSPDFVVMPLEALWWTNETGAFDYESTKATWNWTSMILQPDFASRALFKVAMAKLKERKDPPALSKLRLERFAEGLSLQIMHIGPYSSERATIERLHTFARENGYRLTGKHHEIYLGDPRKTAPAKLKTVLRQPVKKG